MQERIFVVVAYGHAELLDIACVTTTKPVTDAPGRRTRRARPAVNALRRWPPRRRPVMPWPPHLAMMAAHKADDMGAAHAQAMWVARCRAAPKNVDTFARAGATLTRTPACPPR
ncbi:MULTISPECIES: hypothetical protein [unclassified Kribbella]|uniref:hypothetical protein n=1 Tax=unclassified Kribbella TaxID=2644121 RepID=UPI00340D87D6